MGGELWGAEGLNVGGGLGIYRTFVWERGLQWPFHCMAGGWARGLCRALGCRHLKQPAQLVPDSAMGGVMQVWHD